MNAPISLHNLLPVSGIQQGTDVIHESAHLHVTGSATFTDDMPELAGTLYAALIMSPVAHGELIGDGIDRDAILKEHGVVAVYTAKDIPGENNCGPIVHDDPFLAVGKVEFLGQAVAVVVAREMLYAREAAHKAKVLVKELPPILTIDEAMAAQSFVMPPKGITRGNAAEAIANAPRKVKGSTETGQQEQFYMEGQITYAVPREDGQLTLYSSTQHPDGNQREAAAALNLSTNDVEVICRRMGGGFGGKEDQATPWAVMAALAAFHLNQSVKLILNRHDDLRMTGKRHPYESSYKIGLSKDLKIIAYEAEFLQNSGAAADLSPAIAERTLFHATNSYFVENVKTTVLSCKTNLPPNTAFRGFGGPQGMFVIECAIVRAASEIGVSPIKIQEANLLQEDDSFSYGQIATQVEAQNTWDSAKSLFNLASLEKEVEDFNLTHQNFKKGLALMPIAFGISFTNTPMNHARALVHIYQDGSVGISTAAVEMGQGVNTKMLQIAAQVFSIENIVVDGATLSFKWTNDYGEGAEIVLTRDDGEDWPPLN